MDKDRAEQSEHKLRQAASEWTGSIRETAETVAQSAIALQDRTNKYAQALVDATYDQLESQLSTTHTLVNRMLEQSAKRRAAFRALRRELFAATIDAAGAPMRRYREELEAVRREHAAERAQTNA